MFEFATNLHRRDLRILWEEAFEDTPENIDNFLDANLSDDNCIIETVNGTVVSAFYLLPAKISVNGTLQNAQYLYAAATKRESRGKGYMAELLSFLPEIEKKRNVCGTFLMPSEPSLYEFYKRFNFIEFFYRREISVDRLQLQTFTESAREYRCADFPMLADILASNMIKNNGNIVWNADSMTFASRFMATYGYSMLTTDVGSGGYMFYTRDENKTEISELVGDELAASTLIKEFLCRNDSSEFELSLPVSSPVLSGLGEIAPNGMIHWAENFKPISSKYSYLGFEMS